MHHVRRWHPGHATARCWEPAPSAHYRSAPSAPFLPLALPRGLGRPNTPAFIPATSCAFSTRLKNSFEKPRNLTGPGEDGWVSKGGTEPLEVHPGPKGRGAYESTIPGVNQKVRGQSDHHGSLCTDAMSTGK